MRIFDPRTDDWNNHFILTDDYLINGLTATGRATVQLLAMNRPAIVAIRKELDFFKRSLLDSMHDRAGAWRHLLQLPLSEWLFADSEHCEQTLAQVVPGQSLSQELCDQIRSRAKYLGANHSAELSREFPPEFYAATYLLAINSAHVYLSCKVSTQLSSQLRRESTEIANHHWLDAASRELLTRTN